MAKFSVQKEGMVVHVCFCLLLILGHFGQKWPLHAHNVYAVVNVLYMYHNMKSYLNLFKKFDFPEERKHQPK